MSQQSYQVGLDNTGLETQAQVDRLAEIMVERGHDVVAVANVSSWNPGTECPVGDAEWEELLVLASKA